MRRNARAAAACWSSLKMNAVSAGSSSSETIMLLFHYRVPARQNGLASTRFGSFSITIEYLLNMGGVVIAKQPVCIVYIQPPSVNHSVSLWNVPSTRFYHLMETPRNREHASGKAAEDSSVDGCWRELEINISCICCASRKIDTFADFFYFCYSYGSVIVYLSYWV